MDTLKSIHPQTRQLNFTIPFYEIDLKGLWVNWLKRNLLIGTFCEMMSHTQSVFTVVFRKPIPKQICQPILHISNSSRYEDGFMGELTSAKRLEKYFVRDKVEIFPCPPHPAGRVYLCVCGFCVCVCVCVWSVCVWERVSESVSVCVRESEVQDLYAKMVEIPTP